MKLITRIVFSYLLLMLIILMVDGYMSYQHRIKLYEEDMTTDINTLGLVMKPVIEDVWQKDGEHGALDIINDANLGASDVNIRFVWLDLLPEDTLGPRISREKLDLAAPDYSGSFVGPKKNLVYYYFPVSVDNKRPAALELSADLSYLSNYSHMAVVRITILTGVLFIVSLFMSFLMGHRIFGRRLDLLVGKIRRIGSGDYSEPLILPGHDELNRLSAGINTMCQQIEETMEKLRTETEVRIAALEQLRHKDRLKTVGRLASGIAHEVGTPLNVISGRAVMITRDNSASEVTRENASIIKSQCDRIAKMIRQLLDFTRQKPVEKDPVDLQQVLEQVLNLMAPLGRKQKIKFTCVSDSVPAVAKVNAEQIQQVIMNLITNAIHVLPNGGNIELGIHHSLTHPPGDSEASEGQYVCIYVQDDGPGIAEEDLPNIFEPFFTTKEVGEGTGLGLSIVHGIVSENSGWIDVESKLDKGSRFSIYLPVESK